MDSRGLVEVRDDDNVVVKIGEDRWKYTKVATNQLKSEEKSKTKNCTVCRTNRTQTT